MIERNQMRLRSPAPADARLASHRSTMTTASRSKGKAHRQRVPAAERRDALIEAAVHEFAHGGLHGTPVERIARRVGVAQPYVFSLFPNKRELFLAAGEPRFDPSPATSPQPPPAFAPPTSDPA